MQYTSASFAAPLLRTFAAVLLPRMHARRPSGVFATAPAVETSVTDAAEAWVLWPLWRALHRGARALRWMQRMPVQAYVLLVALTLAVLMVWKVT